MNGQEPMRVLVVEDDPAFQQILAKRLTVEGYQVAVAGDGREGMRAIVAGNPQLVLADWMMPEVDGLELCQAVKTGLGDGAPYYILLTAKGEISDKLLALQTGADDYLVKPCDYGELMARVRSGMRIVSLRLELCKTADRLRVALQELEAARTEVERLGSGYSLCGSCHRVRLPDGSSIGLERFLRERPLRTDAESHCEICRGSPRRPVPDQVG